MTLLDTCVAIDLLVPESRWHDWSMNAVRTAARAGSIVLDHIILAEMLSSPDPERVLENLAEWNFAIVPLTDAVSIRAGEARRLYFRRLGTRETILADFLIGAHAVVLGIPLLTRDRGRFASYFPELALITPETHP